MYIIGPVLDRCRLFFGWRWVITKLKKTIFLDFVGIFRLSFIKLPVKCLIATHARSIFQEVNLPFIHSMWFV